MYKSNRPISIHPEIQPAFNTIEGRCIQNDCVDSSERLLASKLDPTTLSLSSACSGELQQLEDELISEIRSNLMQASCDESVYTGGPGVAYMFVKAAVLRGEPGLLSAARELLSSWEEQLQKDAAEEPDLGCSLLCGQAGWLCIDALCHQFSGDAMAARRSASAYASLLQVACSRSKLDADEWLYGRAGYLHGLLLLEHVLGKGAVPEDAVLAVAESIYDGGRSYSDRKKLACPLMWKWHGTTYLGAAHGVMGIIFMLLHVEEIIQDSARRQALIETIDWLLSQRLASGNWPKALGRTDDWLVHFCHGAPGAVQMLCKAYAIFGEERYLREALAAGELVWRYGMVRKGPGLCHGFSGNAYTFLSLFRVSQDARWLLRACHFAVSMLRADVKSQCSKPDNPLSLFEGISGAACFLLDLRLAPRAAAFPLYEVGGFGGASDMPSGVKGAELSSTSTASRGTKRHMETESA